MQVELNGAPALLDAARDDRMTPVKAARKLVAELPDARLVEIAGAGHALMAEAPAACTAAVGAALATALNPSA